MKTIKNYSLLFLLLFFSIGKAQEPPSSEDYNYNTFEAQKKWIIGTFVSDDDATWKLRFTREGKCYWYLPDREPWIFTYTIEYSTRKAETPSGYVDENIYTLYLKQVFSDSGPDDDPAYEMYIDDTGLALYPWPMGIGGQFVFSRVKPIPKSAVSKPTPEPEKESEVSPKWELKLSDYDRGYFDGSLAYGQCKKEQEKEGRDVLDRDRQMTIERMEWDYKAVPLRLGDCREKAFERIRGESEAYRRGFEKGWSDASMPVNNKKDITKKKPKEDRVVGQMK